MNLVVLSAGNGLAKHVQLADGYADRLATYMSESEDMRIYRIHSINKKSVQAILAYMQRNYAPTFKKDKQVHVHVILKNGGESKQLVPKCGFM